MKNHLLTLFIFCSLFSEAQNPLVKMWDYRFGGTRQDDLTAFHQTRDGGYIFGGWSYSGATGDKTQPNWDGSLNSEDYWIVKLDSSGIKQWDKVFGGGSADVLYSMEQTSDGGYILGGWSSSGINGDKTQLTWGGYDYWIVKIDSVGNKEWDKDFGGTDNDMLTSLQQTADGGYILGGYSFSGIGGDKSQGSWGFADYWIVKTDSLGNKQWDKNFGAANGEVLGSVQQTKDCGYILAGGSGSDISGDKTQPNYDPTGMTVDFWLVKTDSLGNQQWDKDYGGTLGEAIVSVVQTSDRGYILAGLSNSGISADKSQDPWGGIGLPDYWILKIDSSGIRQWDKDLGGTDAEDEFGNISRTSDGGYLITGTSYSTISGDKTENNLAAEQTWVIKADSLANKQWDKTIFTFGHEENGFAIQTRDGCYAIANSDREGIGGYRTQATQGDEDYWIVKFCDSTFAPPIATAFADSFLCPGTCTNFINLSFNATSYQWNFPGAAPDTSTDVSPQNICYANSGTYDVQLIATNAYGNDTLTLTNYITVYPTPTPQAIAQSGDTLFAIAGATSYQWYFNGNIISGATNYFYIAPANGDYNVVATDANGCEVEAAVFNVIASVQPLKNDFPIVEPNPISDYITIHFSSLQNSNVHLKIFNSIGEVIIEKEIKLEDQTLNLAALPQGIYMVSILCEGKVYNQKIVK